MLTVDDIKKLTEVFATKQDIAEMEERLASKDELQKLTKVATNLAVEVVSLRHDYNEMNEKMVTKDELRELRTIVENGFGEILKHREEQSIHAQRHDDTEKELRSHGQRLDRIEAVPVIAHSIKA